MAESTVRLGPGEHLARLSRVAEEVRAQLAVYRDRLGPRQNEFPPGVLESLRQLSGTLQGLRSVVDDRFLPKPSSKMTMLGPVPISQPLLFSKYCSDASSMNSNA